jgi:Alginate lyase
MRLLLALLAAVAAEDPSPRVFRLDPQVMAQVRSRALARDARLAPALARLRADAREAMTAGPFTVTGKTATPPSGDKHDYMSQAPYFWRNPATPDGLPYVRRDGERNPEIQRLPDRDGLRGVISHTETLALCYYLLEDDACATRAALLLRTWFLDPATRMNPHLEYGQAIPGVNTGRGIGIIETSGLTRVVDAVGLLAGAKAWTPEDQRGLSAWFAAYLRWLRESAHGRAEAAATNNHGTHYDAQVASFALFTGQPALAAQVLGESRQKRIAAQIEPDGRQPRELERTRAWSYSVMNLGGFFTLAALGERAGVDLWGFQTADGRGLRRALDWLVPFAEGKAWAHPQITPWSPRDLAPLLREAAVRYREERYETLLERSEGADAGDRLQLLHPAPARGGRPPARPDRREHQRQPH